MPTKVGNTIDIIFHFRDLVTNFGQREAYKKTRKTEKGKRYINKPHLLKIWKENEESVFCQIEARKAREHKQLRGKFELLSDHVLDDVFSNCHKDTMDGIIFESLNYKVRLEVVRLNVKEIWLTLELAN